MNLREIVIFEEFYNASEGESSTTDTGFQQKVRLTVTPSSPGDYMIFWQAEGEAPGQRIEIQCEQDDTIQLGFHSSHMSFYNLVAGFAKVTLGTGSSTFDIDFLSNSGAEVSIRRARIFARRV